MWVGIGFALLYLAIPSRLFDTSYNDARMITAAAFILPAFFCISFPNLIWRRILLWMAVALVTANLVSVWSVWLSYRSEYAAMISSFSRISKGSAVLVAHSSDAPERPSDLLEYPIWHAPTLAVAYADAFVSTLFTYPGNRPVTSRPAYRYLGSEVDLQPFAVLMAIASGKFDPPTYLAYARSWPRNYDYLYVIGPHAPNPAPRLLHEVAAGSRFVLYHIDKAAITSTADQLAPQNFAR